MTDGAATDEDESTDSDAAEYNFTGSVVIALVIGAALAWAARTGAVELLIVVAVAQGLLAFAWDFGLRLPGRFGALVIAALASAGADVAVSVWPHSRLGTLVGVLGLAVPVLFVHQLSRGAARVRILESLGGIALLVLAEVALPALLQLRHEFTTHGGDVVFGVVVAATGALVVGYLTDMVLSAPRFDGDVPRGLLAVLASAAAGAALGELTLRDVAQFTGGRGLFAGAAFGVLIALFAVAVAFVEHVTPLPDASFGRRARPVLGVVYPLAVLAPVAFLICLAIRS